MVGETPASLNFEFLREHDALLLRLCLVAERSFTIDPNTTVLKLRQFGEALAQNLAAVFGIEVTPELSQIELLGTLQRRGHLDRDVTALLHMLRREGNEAAHRFETSPGQAKEALKIARTVAIWLHRAFGRSTAHFKPGPFKDPGAISYIAPPTQSALVTGQPRGDDSDSVASESARHGDLERRLALLQNEKSVWEQLAQDEERQRLQLQAEFDARLTAVRAEAAAQTPQAARAVVQAVAVATGQLTLDEEETRALIDDHLRAAGWEADTKLLRFSKGTRPEAGKNIAIAEWPTASGPADYVLFRGPTPLAVVEAKKFATDVSTVVEQAERYSLGFDTLAGATLPCPTLLQTSPGPFPGWPALHLPAGSATHYRIPFVFATNGRAFHRQLLTKSGVWFRDVRRVSNRAKALSGWHTPDGLQALLALDLTAADQQLTREPFGYMGLRDYQIKAVQAIEAAIAAGRREILVAMATGTGKTRTVIGLIYQLIKASASTASCF